jgi:hypothetical protein
MKNYIYMTPKREGATLGYHIREIRSLEPFGAGSLIIFVDTCNVIKRLAVKEPPTAILEQIEKSA